MQLTLFSVAITPVPTSVATVQVLTFCCNYAGDCFCCNYTVRNFCNIYAGESFCNKYMGDNFHWHYACGRKKKSWRWYFLQECIMHMTISIVIMQATVSVVASCVWQFQVTTLQSFLWYPIFIKLTRKHHIEGEGIKPNLNFTTLANILPKLRYFVCG